VLQYALILIFDVHYLRKFFSNLPFFIFFVYLFLAIVLIINIPFFKNAKLGSVWLAGLFLVRIVAGIAYGYVHAHPPPHIGLTDTWKFFNESLPETELLKQNPKTFFQDFFPNNTINYHLFSTQNNFWNNIKFTIMVKLAAIFNLFSFGNYYVNLIFYNLICFWGSVFMYKILENKLNNKFWTIVISFLIPSVVFWGSGYHKEGLILTSICAIIFYVEKLVFLKRYFLAIPILFFTILLFTLRVNILFAFVPAMLCWILSMKFPRKAMVSFLGINAISLVIFFMGHFFSSLLDFPRYVAERQWEFIQLQGKTMIEVPRLTADFAGFVRNFPFAIKMVFVHPYFGEGGLSYIPFSVETFLFTITTVLGIGVLLFKKEKMPIFFMFCLNFGVLMLLIIGYTVPNVGAIVRYKSVALPFLLAAFMPIFIKTFSRKQIH